MKKMLVPTILMAALALPLAHALPGPGNGPGHGQGMGPGAHQPFDRPPIEQVRPDMPHPKWNHHHFHAPKMGKHHAPLVRTFGMDEVRAKLFMDRIGDSLRLTPPQEKAWEGMQKSYLSMVKSHLAWRGERVKDAKPLPHQKRLEMRAERMEKQARLLKDFAKSRAAMEKVMTPQQMRDFDRLMSTGKLNLVPPPEMKK